MPPKVKATPAGPAATPAPTVAPSTPAAAPAKSNVSRETSAVPAAASGRAPSRSPLSRIGSGGAVDNGAGLVLAFFAWVWIGLPFTKGGVKQVRDVLRAKFMNQNDQKEWL